MNEPAEILLIDDSIDDALLFERAVLTSGLRAQVTIASDAAKAVIRLNKLGKHAGLPLPDLIVLDLDLPGLQGKTFLQIIRNAYGKDFVPVVILTGSLRENDRAECEAMGSSDFIRKPGSQEELVSLVTSLARFLPKHRPCSGSKDAACANVRTPPL